jgi:hypothetical protein
MGATNSFSNVSREGYTEFHEALEKLLVAPTRLSKSCSTPQQKSLGKSMKILR